MFPCITPVVHTFDPHWKRVHWGWAQYMYSLVCVCCTYNEKRIKLGSLRMGGWPLTWRLHSAYSGQYGNYM